MGRDKPKKMKNMGYFESQNYYREKAKDYNINPDDFENAAHGGGRYEDFDEDGFQKAVQNAMRTDHDYRTSALHMDDVKGDGSVKDFIDYERAAQKLHKKAGNEGKYSSIKDITGVTNNLVNDAQRLLRDKIDALSIDNDDEQTNTSIMPDEPSEPSPELLKQQGILANWEKGYGPGGNLSPYNSNFQDMAYNPEEASPYRPTTNVDEFARRYKDDIKDVFQFRPTIA